VLNTKPYPSRKISDISLNGKIPEENRFDYYLIIRIYFPTADELDLIHGRKHHF
jgi:hypothetical protein